MENNIETTTVQTDNFKHTLVKLAIATIASAFAKKAAEKLVDNWIASRQTVATVEIVK